MIGVVEDAHTVQLLGLCAASLCEIYLCLDGLMVVDKILRIVDRWYRGIDDIRCQSKPY